MQFVILFKLKGEAIAAAMERPNDRAAVVGGLLEAVGGRLLGYYWMFGQYDGMVLGEVPGSMDVAAAALAVSSSGAFANLETHELIPADQVQPLLDRAKQAREAYAAIGAG